MKENKPLITDDLAGALAAIIALLFLLPLAFALSGLLWGLCARAWFFAAQGWGLA